MKPCIFFNICYIQGGFGVDFSSDPDKLEEGLKTVSKGLLQHGVTSYCPTIVTSSQASYNEVNNILLWNSNMQTYRPVLLQLIMVSVAWSDRKYYMFL